MALMALALSSVSKVSRWYFSVTVMGLFGATLFYGTCQHTWPQADAGV